MVSHPLGSAVGVCRSDRSDPRLVMSDVIISFCQEHELYILHVASSIFR